MSFILVTPEVLKAIGLSIAFIGVMLSIIVIGIYFLIYNLIKKKKKEIFWMAGLVSGWAIFLILNAQTSSLDGYEPLFLVYSLAHVVSIIVGLIVIILFLGMFSKLWKVFDKKFLIVAGVFAICALALRVINPFFANPFLSLIQRVFAILPSLLGFFMIIKSYIGKRI